MTTSHIEKSVIDYLTNKGAATKFELKEAINCGKGGVQSAVARLAAIGRVEATPVKKKHNSPRGHVVYRIVAAPVASQPKVASVNVFEHPEIYSRLHALENQIKRINNAVTDLEKNVTGLVQREGSHTARLNKTIKYVNDFDLDRIRIDGVICEDRDRMAGFVGRMDGFAARLIALEQPQPAVDPVYAEIEQDLTDKLGGQVSPELLRTFIDEAYAERTK
jgi:hypothetical protein